MNNKFLQYCKYYKGEEASPYTEFSDDSLFYDAERLIVTFAYPDESGGDLWFYDYVVCFICKWMPYEQERLIRAYFEGMPEMIERYEVYF